MSDGAYLWPISVIYTSCNCNVPGLIQVDAFLAVRLLLSLRMGLSNWRTKTRTAQRKSQTKHLCDMARHLCWFGLSSCEGVCLQTKQTCTESSFPHIGLFLNFLSVSCHFTVNRQEKAWVAQKMRNRRSSYSFSCMIFAMKRRSCLQKRNFFSCYL